MRESVAEPHAAATGSRENAISASSRSPAAPESIASRASPTPSPRSRASPPAAIAPAALSSTASRFPPSRAREDAANRLGVVGRIAAAELLGSAALDAQVERIDLTAPHLSVRDLADEVRACGRKLVHAGRTVDDERALGAETGEHVRDRRHELRRVHADDLRPRAGRVRQRPEHVEDRPRCEVAANRRRVPHRRMMRRGEQEAEAELVDRARDRLRRQLEVEAERLEHVSRAGGRGDGAVPVLRDPGARGCGDERGRGRDVERPGAVASGPGRVHEIGARGPDDEHVLAHRLGATGDLVGGLALDPQRDEKRSDLRGRRLAGHDRVHHVARVLLAQVAPVHQLGDGALDHAASRKLRISCGPIGVSTDSGWNWTPCTGSSRWRTAMISPSAAVAATSSSSGTLVAASEW